LNYKMRQVVISVFTACMLGGAPILGMPAAAHAQTVIIVNGNQPYYPQPYPYPYPHERVVSVPSYYADLPTDYYGYGYRQSYYHALVQPYERHYRSYWGW
jgi:hypothetical protein